MKDLRKRRKFTKDFKLQVIHALVSGKSVCQISREYQIHETQIYKWQREYERSPQDAFNRKYKRNDDRVAQLEKMVGRLHMENDILKQATAILEEKLQQYRNKRSSL